MAPIRTNSPPRTIDWRRRWRGGWLMSGPRPPGPLAGGASAMSQPYAGGGCCQWTAPALGAHRGRWTEVVQPTLRAARRPRDADPAPVQDPAPAEPGPLLPRQHAGELRLRLHPVGAPGQT